MIPDVLLVAAAVVTSTIALGFVLWIVLWIFRSYLEFKRNQEKIEGTRKRFAEIRTGAVDKSGRSLDPKDLKADTLVDLLYEIPWVNLADVPRGWVVRAGQLTSRD